ncbi:MAG TPA: hypothetical protein VGP37_04450 [Candidatus Nanopelagicales bacterium]|nr:hypothetical protein [Candidatus Nanopelagicales bacterium]
MDWLSAGAVVAGVALLVAWYKADNADTPDARRPWLIVRYGAIGFIVLWLVVEGPNMYRLLFEGGLE